MSTMKSGHIGFLTHSARRPRRATRHRPGSSSKKHGEVVGYTLAESPVGNLLLAGTDRGVCRLGIGDEEAALVNDLLAAFPAAVVHRDDDRLAAWMAEVLQFLHGERDELNLPLDVHGTAFQRRVWQELCRIPYGETRSYSDIARALGQPKACRAVGRACATNPVALIVPCHRVIGADGGLHGFGCGLDRKRLLLDGEQRGSSSS